MKIVIDTNVFASGVYWKGPPYRILQMWESGRFKLVVSPPILDEYRRVLIELSIHRPGIQFERALALIDLHADVVKPIKFAHPICSDPDDDKFLGTALSAGASYVITGDKALLKQNGFRDLQVLSPKSFLNITQ